MSDLIRIPFHGTDILTVDVDGKAHVILKPAIEALGLAYQPQHRKLAGKSWASVTTKVMQMPGDDQAREYSVVDVRTFLMLLATIDERRVSDEARPLLIAYQSEVADVIEAYWTQGGAINPRATEDQLDAIDATIRHARGQMEVLNLGKGILPAEWLSTKAQIVAARALGEKPEIAAVDLPMYVDEFLKGKNLTTLQVRALRSPFGRKLSQAHYDFYGYRPEKAPGEVDGRPRPINVYYGRDLHLFDKVWREHFSDTFGDLFELGGAA